MYNGKALSKIQFRKRGWKRITINDVKIVEKESKEYPTKLYDLKDAPKRLYAIGNVKLLNDFSIAVVGARKASNESIRIAQDISFNIAKNNVQIVSGMALGIDTAGHRGALDAKGKTIAVLRLWF